MNKKENHHKIIEKYKNEQKKKKLVTFSSNTTIDENNGKWKNLPPMAKKRRGCTTAKIDDDRFIVVGGQNDNDDCLASIELFDHRKLPNSNPWITTVHEIIYDKNKNRNNNNKNNNKPLPTLNTARWACAGACINNRIYVVGGSSSSINNDGSGNNNKNNNSILNSMESLHLKFLDKENVQVPSWRKMPSMNEHRVGCVAVACDHYLYVFGGMNRKYQHLKSVERYDTFQNIWEYIPSMTTKRYRCTATLVDRMIYIMGGDSGNLTTVEIFDVDKQRWKSSKSLTKPRYGFAAVTLVNRFIVCMGGTDPKNKRKRNDVEVYDTKSRRWRVLPPKYKMGSKRGNFAAVTLKGNNIMVAGGKGESNDQLDTVEYAQLDKLLEEFYIDTDNIVSRAQPLIRDQDSGVDHLNIKDAAHALANIMMFDDLELPFVVAILGSWGSGKSYAFNLIREKIIEIQKYELKLLNDNFFINDSTRGGGEGGRENKAIQYSYPYVGHTYIIKFSAWVYAKGNLWSSLMYSILDQLNDQLYLESLLLPQKLPQISHKKRGKKKKKKRTRNTDDDDDSDEDEDDDVVKRKRSRTPSYLMVFCINLFGGFKIILQLLRWCSKKLVLFIVASYLYCRRCICSYDPAQDQEWLAVLDSMMDKTLRAKGNFVNKLKDYVKRAIESEGGVKSVYTRLTPTEREELGELIDRLYKNQEYFRHYNAKVSKKAKSIVSQFRVLLTETAREEAINESLSMSGGISIIETFEKLNSGKKKQFEEELLSGKCAKKKKLARKIGPWSKKNGNVTYAMLQAITTNYEQDKEELDRKTFDYAWERTKKQTKKGSAMENLLKVAQQNIRNSLEDDDNIEQLRTQLGGISIKEGIESLNWFNKLIRMVAVGTSAQGFAVFIILLVPTIAVPFFVEQFQTLLRGLLPAIPIAVGILQAITNAQKQLEPLQKIFTEANQISNRKSKDTMRNSGDLEEQGNKDDEELRKLRSDINGIQDRLWMAEGESLDTVVRERLEASDYESELGIVHRAQRDLERLSNAMLSNERRKDSVIFPRGKPRVVLFVDDLDRCPPDKVVEMLEALQLIVKTKLFVVVAAIDARYVTLCLEKEYNGILEPDRAPTGLEYLEKIIQIPYRIPPITKDKMKSYLKSQMNFEEKSATACKTNDWDNKEEEESITFEENEIEKLKISYQKKEEASEYNTQSDAGDAEVADNFKEGGKTETEENQNQQYNSVSNVTPSPRKDGVEPMKIENIFSLKYFFNKLRGKTSNYNEDSNQYLSIQSTLQPSSPLRVTVGGSLTAGDQTPSSPGVYVTNMNNEANIPAKVVNFTEQDFKMIEEACDCVAGMTARCTRRIVNVFKIIKFIWQQQEENDKLLPPSEKIQKICLLFLCMSASTSTKMRIAMRHVFDELELLMLEGKEIPEETAVVESDENEETSKSTTNSEDDIEEEGDDAPALLKLILDILEKKENKIPESCITQIKKLFKNLKWEDMKDAVGLVRSFSFVGETSD